MRLSEYRQTAKDRLKDQWGINVGLVVIVGLLTGAIGNVSTLTTNTESVSTLMNIGVLGLYVILTLAFLLVTTIISIIFKFAVWVKFDYPDLSVGDCIKRAWSLLKDRWGKYISLQLSFIGWYILGFVALIVGLLFVAVYVNTASAAFYDQALKEKINQGELA